MTSIFRLIQCFLVLTLLLAGSRGEAQAPDLWLVMVDVDRYDDPAIEAKRPSKALVDGLENYFRAIPREAPPFASRKLWRLTSQETDVRKLPKTETVRSIFTDPTWGLQASVKSGDSVLFCFAGEGMILDGQKWLLTSDASMASIPTTSLSFREVEEWLAVLERKGASAEIFLVCDFSAAAPTAAPVATAAAPIGPIEGVVVFDAPPLGTSTIHRVVLQDTNSRQTYLSWDRRITESMQQEQRPRLGARLVVRPSSGTLDELGAIPVRNAQEIENLGISASAVWPPKAELSTIDVKLANHAIWTEGQVVKIEPGADPLPTFMTITNGDRNVDVVFWDATAAALNQSGKTPKVGDTIRIGGMVQLYRGAVQLRFHHPEHLAVVRAN